MADGDPQDILLKWAELVTGQSDDLWSVALALLVAQVFIIATMQSSTTQSQRGMIIGAYISTICSFLSLLFGYLTKGAVIGSLQALLKPGATMEITPYAGFNALVQAGSLVVGLVIFVGLFGVYRTEIGKAILGLFGR
ncbi:hypothetical protein AB9F43_22665 [Rhizobium leguminosarum]|uniref:hypothetical protein n=1 Tax=Rhizobium leguminosarum TaxID=384 RepID=UPI003F9C3088